MYKHHNLRKTLYSISVPTLTKFLIICAVVAGLAYYLHTATIPRQNAASLHAQKVSTTSTNIFTIPEYGIQLTLPAGLTSDDIQYYAQIDRPGTTTDSHLWSTVSFTTKSLLQLDNGCTAEEGSIGMIVRYSEDPTAIKAEVRESRPLGNHYFAFAAPQGSCTTNPNAQKLESSQIKLLQQTFETIN